MKLLSKMLLIIVIFLVGTSTMSAQGDIITAKEFKKLIKSNPDLVIVDASWIEDYEADHVKNAINLDHVELHQDIDMPGIMLPIDELAKLFGEKGISETSEIVVYDEGSQKYSSRVYWALIYAGAKNVKLVHRDLDEWSRARIPLTASITPLKPTTFTPTIDASVIVDLTYVKENINNPDVIIIDNRTIDEFTGTGEKASKSKGHIPGAIHCNYKDLLEENGAFKSAEALKKRAEELGITADKEVIFYCKTSIRGAVGWVVVKNILGLDNARLFDGAYVEWVVKNEVEN